METWEKGLTFRYQMSYGFNHLCSAKEMKRNYRRSPNHISEQEMEPFNLQNTRKKHAGIPEMPIFLDSTHCLVPFLPLASRSTLKPPWEDRVVPLVPAPCHGAPWAAGRGPAAGCRASQRGIAPGCPPDRARHAP